MMPQESTLLSLILIGVSFICAFFLTGLVRKVLLARDILDQPNERSSHKYPVPRGGGWALIALILPALAAATAFIDQDLRHVGLILALVLLAGISWLDDRHHVSASRRLSLHILAACLGSFSFAPDEMIFSGTLPFWLDRTMMIIGWAWFINLYNFMDGIDGITSVETVSLATGICLVMSAAGIIDPFVDFTTLILTGICLGFLAHNWYPAKIFLGDIGSIPLGYLTGFCLITLAVKGHMAAALILPLYYLADSGITIGKRALRGEKIWQAHRQHFYQMAALGIGRHDKVVFCIAGANITLWGVAVYSVISPWLGLALGIVIVAILLIKLHKLAITKESTL